MAIKAAPGYQAAAARARQQASLGYLSPMPNVTVPKAVPLKPLASSALSNAPAAPFRAPTLNVPAAAPVSVPQASNFAAPRNPMEVYQGEILSDPAAQGALSTFTNTVQQGRNDVRDALRSAVIRSGWDPTGQLTGNLSGYAGDIDQGTLAAAQQNQLSDRAQLQKQLGQGQSALLASLAARGMSRSGSLPTGNTSLQEQYQVSSNQALNNLVDSIRGSIGGYNTLQSNAAAQLDAARAAVAQRLAGMSGYSGETTNDYQNPVSGDYGGGSSTPYDVQAALLGQARPAMLAQANRQVAASNVKQSFANTIPVKAVTAIKKIQASKKKGT